MNDQAANPVPILSVAIIDDVFASPDRDSVESALPAFCDAVDEGNFAETLLAATGNDFLDPALVDDDAVESLFERRERLAGIAPHIESLFKEFIRRRDDLDKIIEGIKGFKGTSWKRFSSIGEFNKCKEKFRVIFLDYRLKAASESAEIAKAVYDQHRAFIVLMSDLPDHSGNRESEFRDQVGLLQGFFKYVPKETLVDPDAVYRTMSFVPENPTVCHAIHDLIDGLKQSLVGDGNMGGGAAVVGFLTTIRNLPLQDYALLCELTLADEGHPLGDYVRRLFGSHLVNQVFTSTSVSQSLKTLDSLRFTEFLPLAGKPSDSLKELYASSLVEPITNPWGEHPWEDESAGDEINAGE